MKKTFIMITAVTLVVFITGCSNKTSTAELIIEDGQQNQSNQKMTEEQAKKIAEKECIKQGESIGKGSYNEYTKTWWFDVDLVTNQKGCNPACVVMEENATAEINWRCTGLILPESDTREEIKQIFIKKYPSYEQTLSVNINFETENHVRGSINFEPNAPGGIFLAVKNNEDWQIVFDGNGEIPCTLKEFGFPNDMISDCASQ